MLSIENLFKLAISDDVKAVRINHLRGRPISNHPDPSFMGVVNLSPDSWYRESVSLSVDAAIRRGRRLVQDGASIIDIGAESTILDASRADASLQKSRLLPVVKALASEGVLVSCETYLPEVAEACMAAGASILNLTASADTDDLYRIAADHGAGVIICYIQSHGNVRDAGDFLLSENHMGVLEKYFDSEMNKASRAGVGSIWLDPGMGFYYRNLQDSIQRVNYQMKTFLGTSRLRRLGWPVCHALPHAFEFFEDEVRCAEGFFAVLANFGKTDLLRTHEVSKVRAVTNTMKAYL